MIQEMLEKDFSMGTIFELVAILTKVFFAKLIMHLQDLT